MVYNLFSIIIIIVRRKILVSSNWFNGIILWKQTAIVILFRSCLQKETVQSVLSVSGFAKAVNLLVRQVHA